MRIYQHIDEYRDKDGIGSDIAGLHKILGQLGHEPQIVCRKNLSGQSDGIVLLEKFEPEPGIHILHYGGSGYPLDRFLDAPGPKILRFHNFTPSVHFYGTLSEDIYNSMRKFELVSSYELEKMKSRIFCVLSDSDYNSSLLRKFHYTNIHKLPVVRDYSSIPAASRIEKKIGFVGRFVPNKRLEDIVVLLYFLKKIDPEYRLVLAGTYNSAFYEYMNYVKKMIAGLGLDESVEFFVGADEDDKRREMQGWAAYVSFSEHEGFGIPLLEAFSLGIPVMAYDSSAIRETMRGGGIIFGKKDFLRIAGMVHVLYKNKSFRSKIVSGQKKAVAWYENFDVRHLLSRVIGELAV